MSVSSQSSGVLTSSSDTDSSALSSVYMTASSGEISPFDDNVEPLASPEEIAEYNEAVADEQHLEDMLEDCDRDFCVF